MAKKKLTEKQKRFCDEYLIDLNATQAAIRAGYSEKTAFAIGSENLRKPLIKERIEKRREEWQERTGITQDRVLMELACIAFSKATDYAKVVEKELSIEVSGQMTKIYGDDGKPILYKTVEPVLSEELTEEQQRALAVIKKGRDGFEIKPYDKLRALEKLGEHLGMFSTKEENATGDVTIINNIPRQSGDVE